MRCDSADASNPGQIGAPIPGVVSTVAVQLNQILKKGDRLKVGIDGMVGRVAATGKMHYAPDVRLDPYYLACEESTLSEVAIPLLVEGKVIGVFSASHSEVDAFPPQQLQLLHALCEHIAVALQNCRRFRAEQEQRQRMTR